MDVVAMELGVLNRFTRGTTIGTSSWEWVGLNLGRLVASEIGRGHRAKSKVRFGPTHSQLDSCGGPQVNIILDVLHTIAKVPAA